MEKNRELKLWHVSNSEAKLELNHEMKMDANQVCMLKTKLFKEAIVCSTNTSYSMNTSQKF